MNIPNSTMGTSNNKNKFKVFVDDFLIPFIFAGVVGFIAYKIAQKF